MVSSYHDVSASSQFMAQANMTGFCFGYLNQYCRSTSMKKSLTLEIEIFLL